MRTFSLKFLIPLILFSIFVSCNIENKRTTLVVQDPERHYYPIIQGQKLEIQYKITNTGKNPLFITDIMTSCGCVLVDKSSFKALPAGGSGFIMMTYDSNKNIGYVKHYVTIYANFEQSDKYELVFDVHVVPDALYTKDYEELYKEYKEKHMNEKTMVEGEENNLGYYIGEP